MVKVPGCRMEVFLTSFRKGPNRRPTNRQLGHSQRLPTPDERKKLFTFSQLQVGSEYWSHIKFVHVHYSIANVVGLL